MCQAQRGVTEFLERSNHLDLSLMKSSMFIRLFLCCQGCGLDSPYPAGGEDGPQWYPGPAGHRVPDCVYWPSNASCQVPARRRWVRCRAGWEGTLVVQHWWKYVSHSGKEYVCVVRLHDAIAGETKLANVSRLLGWAPPQCSVGKMCAVLGMITVHYSDHHWGVFRGCFWRTCICVKLLLYARLYVLDCHWHNIVSCSLPRPWIRWWGHSSSARLSSLLWKDNFVWGLFMKANCSSLTHVGILVRIGWLFALQQFFSMLVRVWFWRRHAI